MHSSFRALREQVQAGISMGIAGIAWWTTDVGGFLGGYPQDAGFRELLVRWFEWAVFTPVLRMHGARQPFEKLEEAFRNGVRQFTSGQPNEIYSYGEEVYGILRKYLTVREKLQGYLSGLMREAHEKGLPFIRALFLEYPRDARSWEVQDEYLLGAELLVAPVMEAGQRQRTVYFPGEEIWVSIWDGMRYTGGSRAVVEAPLDRIPVFVRQDAGIGPAI